jgi:hypothetical protein
VYRSCSAVHIIKYTRFLWTEHVARVVEETKNTLIILIQELSEYYD